MRTFPKALRLVFLRVFFESCSSFRRITLGYHVNVTPVKDVQNRTLKKPFTSASDQTPESSWEFQLRWVTADRRKNCWQEREVPRTFGQKAASDVLPTVTTETIKRLLVFVQAYVSLASLLLFINNFNRMDEKCW